MDRRLVGWLGGLTLLAFASTGSASAGSDSLKAQGAVDSPAPKARQVEVLVTKVVLRSKRIVYQYTVVNGSRDPITGISIGRDFDHGSAELTRAPAGWRGGPVPDSSFTSPRGWSFDLIPMQDGGPATADWEVQQPADAIAGGRSLGGFSVSLSAEDIAYEQGHWTVCLDTDDVIVYSGTLTPAK